VSRPPRFEFPHWLWVVFGVAVVAISVPLALQRAFHGELHYACASGRRSTVPLAARDVVAVSGPLVYLSVVGWLLLAASGACLWLRRSRAWATAPFIAGLAVVVLAVWPSCQSRL
jgi:hypothetical protein